jgi:hypothetical protein
MPPQLTTEIIIAAITGFESQKQRIDEQIAELRQMLNPISASTSGAAAPPKAKRKLSAAGLKAIRDAVRKRWAAVNAAKVQSTNAAAKPARKKASSTKKAAKRTLRAKKAVGSKQIPAS